MSVRGLIRLIRLIVVKTHHFDVKTKPYTQDDENVVSQFMVKFCLK